MKNVLVTGGAGYIGSVVVKQLVDAGYQVIILDLMGHWHLRPIINSPILYEGDYGDTELLHDIFKAYKIDAIVHMGGLISVAESEVEQQKYYIENFMKSIALIRSAEEHGVKNFIFSSSAAVYGNPEKLPISEKHPLNPINNYGRYKMYVEEELNQWQAFGMKYYALRYFNATGNSQWTKELHWPETHLIPKMFDNLFGHLPVFGDDYETKDGTAIRDYVHVEDIASAHVLLLEKLLNCEYTPKYDLHEKAFNIGLGIGYSIEEVALEFNSRIGPVALNYKKRRDGDPAQLVADPTKLMNLGWKPKYDTISKILETYIAHLRK